MDLRQRLIWTRAIFLPILTYALIVWVYVAKSTKETLQRQENVILSSNVNHRDDKEREKYSPDLITIPIGTYESSWIMIRGSSTGTKGQSVLEDMKRDTKKMRAPYSAMK